MNLNSIYEYRFAGVDPQDKIVAWKEIAEYLYNDYLNKPQKILDPAGGYCEFINLVPSKERWVIDLNKEMIRHAGKEVHAISGNNMEVDIPQNYFDAVFVSNFLEHLNNAEEVAMFLERMKMILKPKGRIVVLGPNYKYVYREYFDFADHKVILSETTVAEHLHGAGYTILKIVPAFLPFSFKRKLPVSRWLVRTYLSMPFLWNLFGEQFLLVAEKP